MNNLGLKIGNEVIVKDGGIMKDLSFQTLERMVIKPYSFTS